MEAVNPRLGRGIPVAIEAKYVAPLQVVETREMRARITKIADDEGVSQASVIRDLLAQSIEWREQVSRERLERV